MKVTCFLTPAYGWRLRSESKLLIIPDFYFKSRPGNYVGFVGIVNRKEMVMASVNDNIEDIFRHISEHYFFDRIYICKIDYLS